MICSFDCFFFQQFFLLAKNMVVRAELLLTPVTPFSTSPVRKYDQHLSVLINANKAVFKPTILSG